MQVSIGIVVIWWKVKKEHEIICQSPEIHLITQILCSITLAGLEDDGIQDTLFQNMALFGIWEHTSSKKVTPTIPLPFSPENLRVFWPPAEASDKIFIWDMSHWYPREICLAKFSSVYYQYIISPLSNHSFT
jgi:hypothetical protein